VLEKKIAPFFEYFACPDSMEIRKTSPAAKDVSDL
jgi:hypothetical protein